MFNKTLPDLLEQIPGRSLLLFTSHRALQDTARHLRAEDRFDCYVQGESDNQRLLQGFKGADRGILLATGSFWEGLDLADTALACVCIDRLPFASPAQPLVKIRSHALRSLGVDAFQQEQLADAVIRLRQGCGRLLRRLSDRGVIMLADPRLHNRPYAEAFVNSLPDMRRTDDLSQVSQFFNSETSA